MPHSSRQGKNNFPDSWSYAKFRVVDAGFGMIALQRVVLFSSCGERGSWRKHGGDKLQKTMENYGKTMKIMENPLVNLQKTMEHHQFLG